MLFMVWHITHTDHIKYVFTHSTEYTWNIHVKVLWLNACGCMATFDSILIILYGYYGSREIYVIVLPLWFGRHIYWCLGGWGQVVSRHGDREINTRLCFHHISCGNTANQTKHQTSPELNLALKMTLSTQQSPLLILDVTWQSSGPIWKHYVWHFSDFFFWRDFTWCIAMIK